MKLRHIVTFFFALALQVVNAQKTTLIANKLEVIDSIKIGGKWYNRMPDSTGNFNIVKKDGGRGLNLLRAQNSSLIMKGIVDSGDALIGFDADSACFIYVNAHDTNSYNALQSQYRADTSKANLRAEENTIDVFITGGQSNAEGAGDSTLSPIPIPGTVLQYWRGVVKPGKDPVGTSTWGSAWPSFGITYNRLTGHKVCFVPASVGGSSQTIAGDWYHPPGKPVNNWDSTGPWVPAAIDSFRLATAALKALGYTPILKGILWDQGEANARAIQLALEDSTAYRTAFQKMIKRFKDSLGRRTPFYIFRSGIQPYYYAQGTSQVISVQTGMTNTDSAIFVVFYNAVDFLARGLMQSDSTHYLQPGYNEMGNIGAQEVINSGSQNWQTQARNVFFPFGNVGIGIDSPSAKLHIVGTQNGVQELIRLPVSQTQANPITKIVRSDSTSLMEVRGQAGTRGDGTPFVSMFLGAAAGAANIIGSGASDNGANTTAVGYQSLAVNTTGGYNTAVGTQTLLGNLTGNFNVAVGERALSVMTASDNNVGVGQRALCITTGTGNTAIGTNAGDGSSNTAGNNNVYVGFGAGFNTGTGSNNIFVGRRAAANIAGNFSSRLYIDGTGSALSFPLIYGDFTNGILATSGNLGIGVQAPTAYFHLKAGTATAGTAPIKLTSGINLTTTEAGVLEFNGSHLYFTLTNGGTRLQLDQQSVSGLADPGSNGLVKRTALNTTAAATSGTDYAPGTSALATGIVKSITSTGALSIAIASDFPTLNQNTSGTASNLSGTPALPNGTAVTTQSPGDNSTKIASTAYGDAIKAAILAGNLSQFGGTSSSQFASVITDETGTGAVVFANGPTLINPIVGTQTAGDNSTKGASTAFAMAAHNAMGFIYTPTIVAGTNASSPTAGVCLIQREDSIVSVTGQINITATAANTLTNCTITLPIASNLVGSDLWGVATAAGVSGYFGPNTVSHIANITFLSGSGTSVSYSIQFHFMYIVH